MPRRLRKLHELQGVSPTFDRASRPTWVGPASSGLICPPVEMIPQVYRLRCPLKDDGSRDEKFRFRAGVVLCLRWPLAESQVSSLFDEAGELFVGYRGLIHPEAIDSRDVDW